MGEILVCLVEPFGSAVSQKANARCNWCVNIAYSNYGYYEL